jgi:hypothetical protein
MCEQYLIPAESLLAESTITAVSSIAALATDVGFGNDRHSQTMADVDPQ